MRVTYTYTGIPKLRDRVTAENTASIITKLCSAIKIITYTHGELHSGREGESPIYDCIVCMLPVLGECLKTPSKNLGIFKVCELLRI